MSYAAEPYSVFVEDLVGNLTGAVSRLRFRFVAEEEPFLLGEDEHAIASTVRVHGLVDGDFRQFAANQDYLFDGDAIVWLESDPGIPAAEASWPDEGSIFWVGFDRAPGHHEPPALTDRNPGSITRTLAESFAQELAVLSIQLETINKAAHLDFAEGRDLDHVTALVGTGRRGQLHARGEVTFRRTTPAPADITIPAGTLVSTSEPPLVTVETVETVTLRRGTLSAAAPVRSQREGPEGVAPARSLVVIHRPILGVEEAINSSATTFGGGAETDEELRGRARRALQTSGRSTVGAIRGALASLEAIREQDILIEEDHLAFPGVLKVKVAAVDELDDETARTASELLEAYRPAGIRIDHNLPLVSGLPPSVGGEEGGGGDGPVADTTLIDDLRYPVKMLASVTPGSTELTSAQRRRLVEDVHNALAAAVYAIGIGEALIFNRIVASAMAVDGVFDVVIDVAPDVAGDPVGRVNLRPPTGTRIELAEDGLEVTLRGALVALDITAEVERFGLLAGADPASALATIRADIESRLTAELLVAPDAITPAVLLGLLPDTADYRVDQLGYIAELLEEGLRINQSDVTIDLTADQQPWVRRVQVTERVLT